ncbi:hypothetical protein D3C76_1156030 [compost metagenome]
MGQLGFLEVADHIGLLQRHHRQQPGTRVDVGTYAQCALADHAVHRRSNACVGQVELGLFHARFGPFQLAIGTGHLGRENVHLLARRH